MYFPIKRIECPPRDVKDILEPLWRIDQRDLNVSNTLMGDDPCRGQPKALGIVMQLIKIKNIENKGLEIQENENAYLFLRGACCERGHDMGDYMAKAACCGS